MILRRLAQRDPGVRKARRKQGVADKSCRGNWLLV
jgi:hypothetical protein